VRQALSRRFASLPAFDTLAEMPLGDPTVQTLSSLCRWAAAELGRPDSMLSASPRSCASLERTILSLFIDCLADRHSETGRRASDLGDAQVRLVEQWMEANLTEPIGVEDLAAVADVSVRSLQLAFRRLRGCTPMQALMRRRLDLARVLLEQGGFGVNVTATAMQLGLFQPRPVLRPLPAGVRRIPVGHPGPRPKRTPLTGGSFRTGARPPPEPMLGGMQRNIGCRALRCV
jgi:AraC-like DNA-binding protein